MSYRTYRSIFNVCLCALTVIKKTREAMNDRCVLIKALTAFVSGLNSNRDTRRCKAKYLQHCTDHFIGQTGFLLVDEF